MLQATLDVHVGSVVTLAMEVRNGGTAAESIHFASMQQYEFEIHEESGALVWAWSAEQMFAQMLSSRTLGPGERWTFVERWQPTVRGRLRARGMLASAGHETECSVIFDVP